MAGEDYVERVLTLVESVPPGRVTSYGLVADAIGSGGPRQVGAVMATVGAAVPWWRVVRADGTLPENLRDEARQHYLEEGTPMTSALEGTVRVAMRRAVWAPSS